VLLCDRGDPGRATAAGAGILSPDTTERDDPAWVELCHLAGAHYDTLLPNLAGDTGWARCGILKLATRDSDVPAFEWTAARAPAAIEITPDEARAMVPVLADVKRALWHAGAARVDGRKLASALRAAATALGVEVRTGAIDDVAAHAAIVDGVESATDAGSSRVAPGPRARRPTPCAPGRSGAIVHLGVDGHDTGVWPIVQPVFGYYMVPGHARAVVGATVVRWFH
jgi:D-amino-acid dehydrogenase